MGGIDDGLLTVPYSSRLAGVLPPSWRLVQPLLSSSYNGWGTASLDSDATELAQLVTYLRKLRPEGRVVFLGHSTGCQDAMHYLVAPGSENRPKIQGVILQAPVSDREALWRLGDMSSEVEEAEALAKAMVENGRGNDVLPREQTMCIFGQRSVVSAKRLLSLTSPGPEHAGEDDYFSSDFSPERLRSTFGKVGVTGARMMVLMGGSDEYVPDFVDPSLLLGRWTEALEEGQAAVDEGTGVFARADHQLESCGESVRDDVFKRIIRFLERFHSQVA